jgi:hypothetical protein
MLLLLMMVVAVRWCGRIVMMWRSSLGGRRPILVLALVVGGPMALGHDSP